MKKGLSTGAKSVIVLTVICLVVTALLALTNHITSPIIAETRTQRIADSLKSVLPDSGDYKEIEFAEDELPATVKNVYYFDKDGSYAVVLATKSAYSSGDMGITVGIDNAGKIADINITSYMESKDFGKETYPAGFKGMDANAAAGAEVYSGVTYSSKAFKKALADAFEAVELAKLKLAGQGGAE